MGRGSSGGSHHSSGGHSSSSSHSSGGRMSSSGRGSYSSSGRGPSRSGSYRSSGGHYGGPYYRGPFYDSGHYGHVSRRSTMPTFPTFVGIFMAMLVFFMLVVTISYTSGSSTLNITKSTVERTKLDASETISTEFYVDELNWIRNSTTLNKGLKSFYN